MLDSLRYSLGAEAVAVLDALLATHPSCRPAAPPSAPSQSYDQESTYAKLLDTCYDVLPLLHPQVLADMLQVPLPLPGQTQSAHTQRCLGRGGSSEAAQEAVRQAVGGGCQSGWGRLVSVTNAIEAGTSFWRSFALGRPGMGGGGLDELSGLSVRKWQLLCGRRSALQCFRGAFWTRSQGVTACGLHSAGAGPHRPFGLPCATRAGGGGGGAAIGPGGSEAGLGCVVL